MMNSKQAEIIDAAEVKLITILENSSLIIANPGSGEKSLNKVIDDLLTELSEADKTGQWARIKYRVTLIRERILLGRKHLS
jgi:hypothetical protein